MCIFLVLQLSLWDGGAIFYHLYDFCGFNTRFWSFSSGLQNAQLLLGYEKLSRNFSFLSKWYKAITVCWCKQPLQEVFKRVYTVYTYSNRMIKSIIILQRNSLIKIWSEVNKIQLILWMVYLEHERARGSWKIG